MSSELCRKKLPPEAKLYRAADGRALLFTKTGYYFSMDGTIFMDVHNISWCRWEGGGLARFTELSNREREFLAWRIGETIWFDCHRIGWRRNEGVPDDEISEPLVTFGEAGQFVLYEHLFEPLGLTPQDIATNRLGNIHYSNDTLIAGGVEMSLVDSPDHISLRPYQQS